MARRSYYEPGGRKSYNDGHRIFMKTIFMPLGILEEFSSYTPKQNYSSEIDSTHQSPLCWVLGAAFAISPLIIFCVTDGFISFIGAFIIDILIFISLFAIAQTTKSDGIAILTGFCVNLLGIIAICSADFWLLGFIDFCIISFLMSTTIPIIVSLNDLNTKVKITYIIGGLIISIALILTDNFIVSVLGGLLYILLHFVTPLVIKSDIGKHPKK